ncbi:flagellar protein FlgN [Jiella mangrovi]|uniref:Flagellar protein FlgN n=1 Tax=Jiella mangrovi TaxID=2821407 RepID=A0ABS4BKG2_9HYPH|nr:flagellar protein FlgN [Jiella mangrovi]MBP0616655.1 flagellar protein FlgN [Jiella mangrovi]
MYQAIDKAAGRLESILVQEIETLRGRASEPLAELTTRKNHCLLELSRLSRSLASRTERDERIDARLRTLKKALNENERVLGLHVKASHEIGSVIAATIAAADSDGTYTSAIVRRR